MIVPYLVGGLEHFLFSHILGIIVPIDFHIFQRGSNHQAGFLFWIDTTWDDDPKWFTHLRWWIWGKIPTWPTWIATISASEKKSCSVWNAGYIHTIYYTIFPMLWVKYVSLYLYVYIYIYIYIYIHRYIYIHILETHVPHTIQPERNDGFRRLCPAMPSDALLQVPSTESLQLGEQQMAPDAARSKNGIINHGFINYINGDIRFTMGWYRSWVYKIL